MALDWNKIKASTEKFYTESVKKIKQYTPESFSKEKKFVNSLVISLALMTMADEKAETAEITASLGILEKIDQIKELDMTQDAIELYEMHILALEEAVGNNTKWTIAIAKLLGEVARIKEYPEYCAMVENLLAYIAESDGNTDPSEVEMQNKIIACMK